MPKYFTCLYGMEFSYYRSRFTGSLRYKGHSHNTFIDCHGYFDVKKCIIPKNQLNKTKTFQFIDLPFWLFSQQVMKILYKRIKIHFWHLMEILIFKMLFVYTN